MDVRASLNYLSQWLYQPRCLLCGHPGQKQGGVAVDLCGNCLTQLPLNKSACSRCALPLPEGTTVGAVCGRCQKKPPEFDASLSLFRYEQPAIWLIQQLKFNDRLAHARLLGNMLANMAYHCHEKPQCIIPVPLFDKRLRLRGFNQSVELAKPAAKKTGIPVDLNLVQRVKPTESQTGLDAKQRKKNIKDAFSVTNYIAYDYVVIIDDVVTTGSTVNEIARLLKKAGVKRVDVWSVARAGMAL
jgi:ComF family protein